jgi:hypothetical protein
MTVTTVSNPSNPTLEAAEYVLKNFLFAWLKKKVIAGVIKKLPFFGMSFINPIFVYFAGMAFDYFYDEIKPYVQFTVIDYQVEKEVEGYKELKDELYKQLQKPVEERNDEEIKKVSDEFDARLRDLIKF